MEYIETLKKERQNIILQIQRERDNKNDLETLKLLKNKYHSLSNKINYQQNKTEIREHKRILNKSYETIEGNEKKRKYAKEYQRRMREIYKTHKLTLRL